MSDFIFHITSRASWSAAQKSGVYAADSLASDGFIHCSKLDQVLRTANAFFAGQRDLVLLAIDPPRLTAELRWEPGTDFPADRFPHVYGPLNLEAVVHVFDFEPDADGKFHLPASLP